MHCRSLSFLILTRLASQTEYCPRLRRSCDRTIQFLCNAHGPLDQFCVTLRFSAARVIDIIFQADSNVTAHEGGERSQRKLKRTDRRA